MTAVLLVMLVVMLGLVRRVVSDHERRRLLAHAEHELRGPLQAIALAAPDHCAPDVERVRAALADLAAARSGRAAAVPDEPIRLDRLVWRAATASDLAARRVGGGVHLDWAAGPVTVSANRGRLAQAFGNLLANAIEHGGGHVSVVGRRTKRGIRVEVRDSGRGHGLAITAKAVREAGGKLSAARAGSGTAVAIELPIAADPPAAADPPSHPADPDQHPAGPHPADPPAAA